MALYMASSIPVEPTEWREGESVLATQALTDADGPILSQFSKPHVVYLGAHTGCSCGFQYSQLPPSSSEDIRENELGRQSVAALRRILEDQLAREETVELFACWEGDQGAQPEQRLSVTPEFFGGDVFDLSEKVLYQVCRAA